MIDRNGIVITHKPLDDITLKRILLVFENVHMISPDENLYFIPANCQTIKYPHVTISGHSYLPLYNGELYKKQEETLINHFDYAYKNGSLKIINIEARKFYEKNWLGLRIAYDFDTGNKELIELTKKYFLRDRDIKTEAGIIRGGFVEPSGMKIYPQIPPPLNDFNSEENKKYHFELQAYSIIARINRSLLVADDQNLVPCFIEDNISQIYMKKVSIASKMNEHNVKEKFQEMKSIELQKIQYALFNISQHIIPDELLGDIPIRELIIARNNALGELYKLHRKLLRDIKFLKEMQFDENFLSEIEQYIKRKIMPEVNDFTNKFIDILLKILNLEVSFLAPAIATGFGLSQSLTLLEAVMLSGVSAVIGDAANNLVERMFKRNRLKVENTYSYFYHFR